ncbi:hypothetical protein LSCM1_02303 [Leishmania martiniquensis]|uniref:Tuzin n=1 Tax=Leishmania martiniquensis TaxID=1580590 RepID=A0A836KJT6_9TRYP|nr:hypothetical protein LSCM1_02303 [Leishmania martiniquensis]
MRTLLLPPRLSVRCTGASASCVVCAHHGDARTSACIPLDEAARWATRLATLDGGVAGALGSTATLAHSPACALTAWSLSPSLSVLPLRKLVVRGTTVNGFLEKSLGAAGFPIAGGAVKAPIGGAVYAVHLRCLSLSPLLEVGSRVYVERGRDEGCVGVVMGGVVVRVNGNGTYGVLLDDDVLDVAVPAEVVVVSEGRAKLVNDAGYGAVVEWVRTAGVARRAHRESIACVLFQRGWRVDRLHLLTAPDVQCATHVPKAVRMCVLEKSEWQRDHHRQMRQLLRERVKERDFRYTLTKYSGVVSASMALLGIAIAFGWNLKNSLAQQRAHQLAVATRTLTQTLKGSRSCSPGTWLAAQHIVARDGEVDAVRQVLRQLDTAHPRIVVFTGFGGCGKSFVCDRAVRMERMPAIRVDVRGAEDALRSVAKALGVSNVDVCGDLLDFVSDACRMAKAASGEPPLLMLALRGGSCLQRVYKDAVALACDRRVCHVVVEVPIESLTAADTGLPRLDFCAIPAFSREQAVAYTQHTADAVSLHHFIDVVGTSSDDLDALLAALHQRRVSAAACTNQKLLKAMRQLQATCAERPRARAALQQLCAFPYGEGQHSGADTPALRSAALSDIVLYDPVKDAWMFRSKLLHTASRCCWV